MNRKVLSVSLICTMLTASFVLVGMTIVKSSPKHVDGSLRPKPGPPVVNQKPEKPDPPGTINGATNPELVPDHVAWSVILGLIANQKTPEQKKRIRGYIKLLGLRCTKCQGRPGASALPGDEADIDKLIGVAEEYDNESKALDTLAGFPLPAPGRLSAQELTARVDGLKKQKEQLVATKVAHLSQRLTPNGYAALINSLDKVKRGIKIVPYYSMPPGK